MAAGRAVVGAGAVLREVAAAGASYPSLLPPTTSMSMALLSPVQT